MIAYVETNFVLELALVREEHDRCETLIEMARRKQVRLVLPGFSLGEPYEALRGRTRQRKDLRERLKTEARELARSRPYNHLADSLAAMEAPLAKSSEEEKQRLNDTLETILPVVELVPIDGHVVRAALAYQRMLPLSPQDSIVYASVLHHLAGTGPERKCFVTQNSNDFAPANVREPLKERGCKLLTRFQDALGYLGASAN